MQKLLTERNPWRNNINAIGRKARDTKLYWKKWAGKITTVKQRFCELYNALLKLNKKKNLYEREERREMILFYEEDKQVTDDEILGLENCCMQKLLTERNPWRNNINAIGRKARDTKLYWKKWAGKITTVKQRFCELYNALLKLNKKKKFVNRWIWCLKIGHF